MDARTQLANAYTTYLGRAANPGEIDSRLGLLGRVSLGTQLADIQKSAEAQAFKSRGANTNVSQPLFDFAAQQKAESEALLNRQKQEQQGLFDQYTKQSQSQEQLPALYQRLQKEAGIPELSTQAQTFKNEIYRVKGLLDRLDEGVTGRLQGTYASQALRDRMIASEGDDLRTDLGRLGTGLQPVADMLTAAQGQVSNMLPLFMQQQTKELRPLEMQINSLSDRFAREITGFNSNRETQLTALMDKLQRDRELSDREWQLAQQLAAEERAYARQKQAATNNVGQYFNPQQAPAPAQSQNTIRQLPTINTLSVSNNGAVSGLQGANYNLQGTTGVPAVKRPWEY